jgi:quinol monooxygenase YgiN
VLTAAYLPVDETGRLEHGDVSRDAGEGHRKGVSQVLDASVAGPQGDEQRPSGGIGQGRIGAIQYRIFKHIVDYIPHPCYSTPLLNNESASVTQEGNHMPIYQTAHYQVKEDAVPKVKAAIEEFIRYVAESEPGTRLYSSWQQQSEPGKFVHLFIFENEAAHQAHGGSTAVRQFEAVYQPELVDGPVVFTDYDLVATNS